MHSILTLLLLLSIHGKGFLLAGALTMAVGIPVWTFASQKERYVIGTG